MKGTIGIVVLLFTIDVQGLRTRIFGGSDTPEGEYPYYAYLLAGDTIQGQPIVLICGGSIIHNRWILTAAHCFRNIDFRNIQVQVGTVLESGQDGMVYGVEDRISHEAFEENGYTNDISLVRVEEDIIFNERVQPIVLANRDTIIREGENAVFSGFGQNQYRTPVITLQTILLRVYNYHICQEVEPRLIETQICTFPEDNKSPCLGDSGGPLVNENGIQIGIDSGSYKPNGLVCDQFPEIYTRVSSFRDWIDAKISQY